MGFSFNGLSGATVTISTTTALAAAPANSTITGRTNVKGTKKQTAVANTPFDIWTPTGGKVGYLTWFMTEQDGNGRFRLGDNISGNAYDDSTNSIFMSGVAGYPNTIVLSVPLKISTKLVGISDYAGSVYVSWAGWEE